MPLQKVSMASSAELAVLFNVSELAMRFGMRPSDAEAWMIFVDDDQAPDGKGYYGLRFSGRPTDPVVAEKFEKFASALGMQQDMVKASELSGLEDIVDRALSVAPRARARLEISR